MPAIGRQKRRTEELRTALITGAFGGMGKATAALLRAQGYRVFAMDRRVETSEDVDLIPLEADVTSEESVQGAMEEISRRTDRLDAVIHFAGIYLLDSLVEIGNEAFSRIVDVNLSGVYRVNRLAMPLLGQGSRILITTSELAVLDPLPFTGIYAVTKAALDKYAFSLRMELQLLGISVSVLRAGAVETDMLGASTSALERFCETTSLYSCNAARFRSIVDRVEARCVPAERIAAKCGRILRKRRPAFAYSINRNPLLLLMNCLPKRLQLWIIRMILR